jgi:O-antigen/teichoic acid export membrane protein
MIAKVAQTFAIRVITAALSFVIFFLNANYLGAKGLGTIGLIILNVTLFVLFCNLIHGAIIYFSSRINRGNLSLIAYLWSLVGLGIYFLLNQLYPLVDKPYLYDLLILGFLQASAGIHHYLLLGNERIGRYNFLSLTQSVSLLFALLLYYFIFHQQTVEAFLQSLYWSYGISYGLAVFSTIKEWEKPKWNEILNDFRICFNYGFFAQAANTFQLLNYRISYFFLDAMSGRIALGQYTASVQLAEALLLPGRSIATVQYVRISRKKNDAYARRITTLFMKLSWITATVGLTLVLLIPEQYFVLFLGTDFSEVKALMAYMTVGIIALSAEVVISHYFSGSGKVKLNFYSASIGLGVTLLGCWLLIEPYGAIGAALTASLSYSSMFLYLFVNLTGRASFHPKAFLPSLTEIKLMKRILRKLRSKS